MTDYSHIYDLGGSVEQWERRIAERTESAVSDADVDIVSVDPKTGMAKAVLVNPTQSDLNDLEDELAFQNATQNPHDPAEVWVSFGDIVPTRA